MFKSLDIILFFLRFINLRVREYVYAQVGRGQREKTQGDSALNVEPNVRLHFTTLSS